MASHLTGSEFQIGTTQTINGVSTTLDDDNTEVPTSKAVKDYADSLKVPAGTIIWFSGNTGKVPSGYLVCNGQAISRTTYADLYAVIGTKYGAGNGSSTFNVPDLSDGNGRFIRAGFTDSVIGTKQADAIRNITGSTRIDKSSRSIELDSYNYFGGSFYRQEKLGSASARISEAGTSTDIPNNLGFSANNDSSSYGNPMANHANGNDIHPYNILMLPLIAY